MAGTLTERRVRDARPSSGRERTEHDMNGGTRDGEPASEGPPCEVPPFMGLLHDTVDAPARRAPSLAARDVFMRRVGRVGPGGNGTRFPERARGGRPRGRPPTPR